MSKIFNSPSKYIQGPDELAKLGGYVDPLGTKALVINTPSGVKRVGAKVEAGFADAKATPVYEDFNGECSENEVNRLVEVAKANGCDVIVGIGGGKTLDTAKATAYFMGCPVVICPTIASSDAPCSALSVLYTDDGQFDRYLFLPANPTLSSWTPRSSRRAPFASPSPAWATRLPPTSRPRPRTMPTVLPAPAARAVWRPCSLPACAMTR